MNVLLRFVEDKLAPVLGKFANQHHLSAVKEGMMVTVPLTVVGSIFVLIPNLPIQAWKDIIAPYAPIIGTMSTVTIGILALVAAASVAYSSAKLYRDDRINPQVVTFISLAAFLLATLSEEYTINVGLFGTRGVFTAILVALMTASIVRFFIQKNLVIKFPDTVPEMVATSFSSLIPGAVALIVVWILRVVMGLDINEMLTSLFSPFVFALNSLPGFLVFMLIRSLLWSVGIHGGAILSVADPIFLAMFGDNLAAFQAGTLPPFITAQGFTMFVFLGGGGATLSLVFFMLRSKEKGFRTLGKLALPASIFEINEPVVFGVPLVMNPLMIIPYTLTTLTLSAGTYILMFFDIIGRPVANIPWTTPPLLSHYLVTGGDWRAVVWGIASLVISGIIYYPFFKSMEKTRLMEERGNEQKA